MAQEATGSKTSTTLASAGTGLGQAVRALRGQKGKRLFSGLLAGGSSMLSTVNRVVRMLALQVVGFVFLVIAIGMGSKAWREYQVYTAAHASPTRFYVSSFFFVLFMYFGLSSFWRARK